MEQLPYRRPIVRDEELIRRTAGEFLELDARRSVRFFSPRPVPKEVIENLIRAASTAPSGANQQPWTFCAVSAPELKQRIREAAEEEEYDFYHHRATEEWLEDLRPLGTDWRKPFLEEAPWLVVIFRQVYGLSGSAKRKHYYVQESVGIAAGFFIQAVHRVGLACLTHTPSPMNFLGDILQRPENEKPFLLIPVGFAAEDCTVPAIGRKPPEEVAVFYQNQ